MGEKIGIGSVGNLEKEAGGRFGRLAGGGSAVNVFEENVGDENGVDAVAKSDDATIELEGSGGSVKGQVKRYPGDHRGGDLRKTLGGGETEVVKVEKLRRDQDGNPFGIGGPVPTFAGVVNELIGNRFKKDIREESGKDSASDFNAGRHGIGAEAGDPGDGRKGPKGIDLFFTKNSPTAAERISEGNGLLNNEIAGVDPVLAGGGQADELEVEVEADEDDCQTGNDPGPGETVLERVTTAEKLPERERGRVFHRCRM